MMRNAFSFTLQGPEWSRLYFWYWGPSLLLLALNWIAPTAPPDHPEATLGVLGITLAIAFLTMMVQSFFTVPILRTWLPALSIDGKAFSFAGDTNDYLVLNVRGFLLSVVTVGVYLPWYGRDVLRYLAQQTSFDGASPDFTGRPGRLLASFGWLLAVSVAVIVAVTLATLPSQKTPLDPTSLSVMALTWSMILLFTAPTAYLVYAWMVQFSWKQARLRWTTKFLPATSVLLVQIVLTVVSVGLWWPGAVLVLYRYFVAHTVVEAPEGVTRFAFEGREQEGYWFLWKQALLTLVTLGFYGAWSGPQVARWLAERTFALRDA